jgi:hypothetical protein
MRTLTELTEYLWNQDYWNIQYYNWYKNLILNYILL